MAKPTIYTISELAKEFSITTRAIRFYEDQGLLHPTREGQKRVYSPKDRAFLTLILRGKRLGFSLSESKEFIELYNPKNNNRIQLHTMIDKFAERNEQLDQQMRDIKAMKAELADAEKRCRAALNLEPRT